MADLSNVLAKFGELVQNAVYPNGLLQPSVAGVDVTIMSGWPIRTALDKALQAGNAFVSIYPTDKEKDVTKFQRVFQPSIKTLATLTTSVLANTVTIGGIVSVPQSVIVVLNKQGYAYQVSSGDTLASIAASLAAMMPNATASGAVITIGGAVWSLNGAVATPYQSVAELRRQERVFMITCWCPTPTIRDSLASAIDVYLTLNYRIPLQDNVYGHLFYSSSPQTDELEKSMIYRRDLHYKMQYATTATEENTTIIDPYANITVVDHIT